YESLRTEMVKVSRDKCFLMIKTKQCSSFPMDCDNEYCSLTSNPQPSFNWMSEKSSESFSCSTSPKLITAHSPNDFLFNGKCKGSYKECRLHDFIIVWDATIYHECPLYKISQETFTITQNSDIILSNNLVLQAINSTKLCDLDVISILEGFYLSIKTNNLISKPSVKDIEEKNELLIRECQDFKSILNIFSRLEDRFLTHFLSDGSRITLYTTMGNIYKNSSLCFKDQQVKMHRKHHKDWFLKSRCYNKTCLGTFLVIEHESFLASDSQLQYFNNDYLNNKFREPQLSHNSLLLDGIDLLSTFEEVINHEMTAGTWYTHMTDTLNIKYKLVDIKVAIENTIYTWLNYGIYIVIGIISLILVIGLFYLFIKIIFCLKTRALLKNLAVRKIDGEKHVKFEMKPLTVRPIDEMCDEIFRSNMSLYSVRKEENLNNV
ncbi:unnamed protein product, partial [Brachionus calyciflorus]